MQSIYVFGHRIPDTDSVCASISLSYLKNRMGLKTTPKVLGHINNETKYVLDFFGVPEPGYLNDVKIQIKNMVYNKKAMIPENASIEAAFNLMQDLNVSGIPLIDETKQLKGIITLKEVARDLITGDMDHLITSYDNILDTLDAKEILRFDEEIIGHIIAVSYKSETFANEIDLTKDDILIVGDRYKVLSYAVSTGVKLIILVGNHELPKELMQEAKRNHVNIIQTSFSSYKTSNKIKLANYVKNLLTNENPVVFELYDYRNDFIEITNKVGHTNYPIVNKKGECLGLIKATNVNSYEKRKVILVDHNQASQSVEGVEEADILEVIDHHNLGTIGTASPINFRSMPVGCTCTVVYQIFQENKIEIPRNIAGLMLSAILSDTMLFKNPTTTTLDKEVVDKLAKLAGVDALKYGLEMFKAGSSIEGMSVEDILNYDYKIFKVDAGNIRIAQVFTMDIDYVKKDLDQYVRALNNFAASGFKVAILLVTDIIKNGSYLLYNQDAEDIVAESYSVKNIEEAKYVPNLISRKKQVLPDLLETLEKYN